MAKAAKKKTAKKRRKPPHHALISTLLDFARQGFTPEDIAEGSGPQPSEDGKRREPNELLPDKLTVEQVREFLSIGLRQIVKITSLDQLKLDLEHIHKMMSTQLQAAIGGDAAAIAIVANLRTQRDQIEEKIASRQPDFFHAIKRAERGQPPYMPNEESRAAVRALKINNVPEEEIARYLKISTPTLRKWHSDDLDNPGKKLVALATNNLARMLKEGRPGATYFTLKTRAGWRETDRPDQPPGGDSGGGKIVVEGGLPSDEPPKPAASETPAAA